MKCAGVALVLLLGGGVVGAQVAPMVPVAQAAEPASAVAERKQIRHDRAAAEARFKQAEAECSTRFAVSGCIADAQAQRRTTLTELRERELVLDEAKRRAEAAENTRRLQAKQAEAAARPLPVPHAASAAHVPAASASPPRAQRPVIRSKTADDPAEAAARAAAQQRRASDAAAHRAEVEKHNAERAARGKKSTPLPVPSAASVAAAASAAGR